MTPDNPVVLVVDDEFFIRLGIALDLEERGYIVLEARDSDEAIAILEDNTDIRLVFTDIDMPGSMDGLKLAAFVRDRWPPIKIIMTSGRITPDPQTMPEGTPFFPKPYRLDEVCAAIARLTGS